MAYDDTITFGSAPSTINSSSDEIQFGGGISRASIPVGLPEQPNTGPTISDHLNNLYGAGWQAIGAIRRGVAQLQPDEESRKAFNDYADEANNNALQHLQDMTPSGRDTAQHWNKHWIQGALMGAEQQVPMLGAAGVGEFFGGPAGAAAVFSALSAGQAADNFYSAIREMPIDKLMENNDFAKLVNSGMSEEDAKTKFAYNHVNDAGQMLVGAVTGAGVGYLGPIGKLFGRGIFDATSQSILKNMAVKGFESGGAMATQSGLMDLDQQQALMSLNLPAQSTSEILEQAGKMGLWGGALGSLGGMRRGPAPPAKPPWMTPSVEEGRMTLPGGVVESGQLALPPPGEGNRPALTYTPTIYGRDETQPPRGSSPWPGSEEAPPIHVPPTTAQNVADIYDQLQDLHDLNRQAREGGPKGGGGPGVSPSADKSAEPSQTPSAPLKSAQAAPLMPERDTAVTDAAKVAQKNQRRANPVAGENVGIRSSREGRTKPAAGRDFGRTDTNVQENAPSIPPHPTDDAQALALQTAFEQEQAPEPTIDSQVPKTQAALTPEQQGQLVNQLRQTRPELADMLSRELNVQFQPVEPRGRPQEAAGRIEPPPAREVAPPPPEARPALPEAPAIEPTAEPVSAIREPVRAEGAPETAPTEIPQPFQRVRPKPDVPVLPPIQVAQPTVVPIRDVEHTGRAPTPAERAETVGEVKTEKPGHLPKWKIDAKKRNNQLAEEAVKAHPVGARDALALLEDSKGGKGALAPLRARAIAMLNKAKELGVTIPKRFDTIAEGGVDHSPAVLILDEAQRFLKHIEGKFTEAERIKAVEKFLMRENDLRQGKYENVLGERAKEAEAALAKKKAIPGRGEEAVGQKDVARQEAFEKAAEEDQLSKVTPQHIKTPEEELIRKERLKAAQKLLSNTIQRWNDAQKKGIKAVADIKNMQEIKAAAEKAFDQARELGLDVPEIDKMRSDGSTGRTLQGLQQALNQLNKEIAEERVKEEAERLVTVGDGRIGIPSGQYVKAKPTMISNIRDMMAKVDYSRYPVATRGMMRILIKKIVDLAGDVPVYAFDQKEWLRFMDPDDLGAYHNRLNNIVIHQDALNSHVPVHEAFHAVTSYAYRNFPEFKALVDRLHSEIVNHPDARFTPAVRYAVDGGPLEMLTEMMSNYEVQDAFKKVFISAQLAKELGIEDFRKASIFYTILDNLRTALGFDPKYMSAIEAAAALGEKGIRLKYPEEEVKFQRRLGEAERAERATGRPPTIDSWTDIDKFTAQVPGRLKESAENVKDLIKYEPKSLWLKLRDWFEDPRSQVVDMEKKGHFKDGSARSWLEHMSQQGYDRTQFFFRKLSNGMSYFDIVKSLGTLGYKKPEEFGKLVSLLISAARHGAHPDDPLFEGRNKFLNLKNPAHWEAIAGHPEDAEKYGALDKATQEIFKNIRDTMVEIRKGDMKAARDSLIKNYRKYAIKQGPEFKAVFEKVAKDEELTPKENEEFGNDQHLQDIYFYHRVLAQDKGNMFYFPMKRTAWKFAITALHNYEKPEKGKNTPEDPHRWKFDDINDAYAFTRDVGLPTAHETKFYFDKDKDGKPIPREYTVSDDVRDIAGENVKPSKEYNVTVNPEHTEFANSVTEGEQIREELKKIKSINKDTISAPLPTEGQGIRNFGFYGPQIEAMKNRVGKLEHLTSYEQKAAQDAIEHAAIASMHGNYLPQSLLPRRRVMGTEHIDIIKAFYDRLRASANFQTMADHRNEIDDAIEKIKEEVKSKRTHADATELTAFGNMIEDRTMNFATDALDDMNMSTMMHHFQAWGVVHYLASPAFLAYHQLHYPLVVLPTLAKHVGMFKAIRMSLAAYRQMLGGIPVIGKGLKGGWERAWNYDREPTDFADALMQELKKHGGKDDELEAIKWALKNDILHNTGINFSSYFKGMGAVERFSQRAMGVSAEVIGAADAVNRFNSMLVFYRAAKDMGKEGEEAFRWAGDRVAETQGQFTAFNRMGIMRSPWARSFLQFKSFPLLLMRMVTKAMYNSLRWGASREERVDAIKTLAGLMGTSMALSGVQGAVPEPVEDINNIISFFGLGKSWDQYEDALRGYVADNMGEDVARYVMNGPVGGGLGIDLTHRGGISNLTGLARIHVTKPQDLENSMFKWLAGVPGSIIGDGIDGAQAMETGDIEGMMKSFFPRVLTDPVKAYQIYNQGVTTRAGRVITPPLGLPDTIKQALGFAPLTSSLAREARYVTGEEKAGQQAQRSKIEEMYKSGDKGYAVRAMNDYNKKNPDNKISLGDLKKAVHEAGKKKIFGYDIPKKPLQAQEMKHRAQSYGVPTQ